MGARLTRPARLAARSAARPNSSRPQPGQPPRPLVVSEIAPAPTRRAKAKQRFAPVVPLPARDVGVPAGRKPALVKRRRPFSSPTRPDDRSEAELLEMARRHLGYEIKMLRETAAALQGKGIGPRSFRNALLETFLIHYRNLLDFFYADKKHWLRHDVKAADYVADAREWRARRPRMDKEASSNRERVNAQLAHLTYRRLRYDQRNWSDRRMLRQIEELLDGFVCQLPPHRRRWFQRAMERSRDAA